MDLNTRETVLEWIKTYSYYPRDYGLKIAGYKVVIITGINPDEDEVPKFDIPLLYDNERIIALYIKQPDLKNDFASTDKIEEGLTSRGMGKFKINTAILMAEANSNSLYEVRGQLLKVYMSMVGFMMRMGLGLDELDTQYIKAYSALHYIKTSYTDLDLQIEVATKYLSSVKLEGLEDNIEPFLKGEVVDLPTTLHDNAKLYETSNRLKSLKIAEYGELINALVPINIKQFFKEGLENNGILASVLLEVKTNLFYKKSRLGTFLITNEKLLNLKDLTKDIDRIINT